MVWPSLDSLSATTFTQPGMCQALRVTCFLVHQVKILHSRAQSRPDLMPPSLFMYDTTVVLSIAIRTIHAFFLQTSGDVEYTSIQYMCHTKKKIGRQVV